MKKFFRRTRQTCDAMIDFCRRNVAGQTNCSAAFKAARRTLTALLIVASVVTASLVGATVKMYTATGEGYAWEDEPQEIAKLRARDKAIKKATREAGVYLKTYSRSVNNELTDDEVLAITSNSWQLVGEPKYTRKIINHSGDTQIIVWTATVEVNVDDAELQSWLKRDDKDKSTIITQTREAQKSSEENERTVEDLRERYNRATSQAERDKIRQQMNQADRDFLADQKLDEGNRLYYAKDYYGAIKLYREAIKLKPDWSWPYNNRGIAYDDLKQYERAIQDYNKAIQLNPNYANAYLNRGAAYDELKQYERAIQDCNKAIELDPNLAIAYNNRGVAYMDGLKQYERAIQDYNKAIQLNPNYAEAYNNRAFAYCLLKKNYDQALSDANKALQLLPNSAPIYDTRGCIYLAMKNYDKALEDFNAALQLNPNLAETYFNRGLCYQKLGDNAKAQADFARAKQLGYNG